MKNTFIKKIREFNRFYRVFLGSMNNRVVNLKFTLPSFRVLFEINNIPNCCARDIVKVLNIDKSYLNRILKALKKDKLIFKKRSVEDARNIFIILTEKGRSELNLLENEVNSRLKVLHERLTKNEREILVKNMNEIKTILTGK